MKRLALTRFRLLAAASAAGLAWRAYLQRLAELRRAKAWYERLTESIAEGLVVVDAAGRITFFNQGAERITGWRRGEALGRGIRDVLNLSESDQDRLIDFLAAPNARRRLRFKTRGGRPVSLAVTGARLVPPDGGPPQTALVLRDVSDEEEGHHLHSYFLANITHEFRTPLAGLNASIELLMDEGAYLSPDEMDELIASIHLSASGLQALVDNLLESVTIEAGHFAIHRRPVAINAVLAEAIRLMQPLLDRRRQTLALTEPLSVPQVAADPTRLTQVLINLLSNASKYSPQAETIDLSLGLDADRLRVAVADRGPGIPPAERQALFQRFVRVGARDDDRMGIGLGLSVVKAIIEGHHGEVGVEENPGGGSVFWFTLPLTGEAA